MKILYFFYLFSKNGKKNIEDIKGSKKDKGAKGGGGLVTRVFISYARADGLEAASKVQKELESGDFEVWRDLRSLDAFNDFSVEIERAIVWSDLIVVCITDSISKSPDSFVRREILYAQTKNKRIVPIRIGGATVPILINHLTWIDAVDARSLGGVLVPELRRRIEIAEKIKISHDEPAATVTFVHGLLDDILDYLETTTTVLLDIAATGWLTAPGRKRGGLPETMRPFRQVRQVRTFAPGALGQACANKLKKILLHGGPGSGKTTSLLVAAREGINNWLEDATQRLPIFCRAADWDAAKGEPLIKWLDRSTSLLPTADLRTAIESGRVTLFVDGLDELESRVIRLPSKEMIDPRRDLLAKLPEDISVLITCRTEALEEIGEPEGFGIFELDPITDEQIAEYLAGAPELANLIEAEPSFLGLMQTPLTLGLLSFIAYVGKVQVDDSPEVGELNARLRVVNDFTLARWQHESNRGADLASIGELVGVLGRVATRHGQVFSMGDLQDAVKVDTVDATSVLQSAVKLGFVRHAADQKFAFFHPSFAEYYATVHCWRYLGEKSSDGYDERLFHRISQLGDPSFIPRLVGMAGDPFWRGEYCDKIAMTLNAIGSPSDPDVVRALLHLAGYQGLGGIGLGITSVGDFARRCTDDLRAQFVDRLSPKAGTDCEVVHQLLGLGEPGLRAVLEAYEQLDKDAPMRSQIESYSIVRQRLGLP